MAFGNLGNIFGAIGSGLAKAATNYATSEKNKKTSTPTSIDTNIQRTSTIYSRIPPPRRI